MAALMTALTSSLLTYDGYMAEPQVEGRYDIVDGVRIFQPAVTWQRQRILVNLLEVLRPFEGAVGTGCIVLSPFDVLIRKEPHLQIRQPDFLLVSYARLKEGGGPPEYGPLQVAPEITVEIISSSETQRILGDKIADYTGIGVDECWVVRPEARTVEMLQPGQSGAQVVAAYDDTHTLTSHVFPRLSMPIADVFRP